MSFDGLFDEEPTTVFGMDDVLTFGKYAGDRVRDVVKYDAQYLKWAFENIDWLDFDEEVLEWILYP